jgi:predicted ATP-grasp superfamily ATP-dependent carboligase
MMKALLEGSGIEVLLAGHTLHGSTHLEDPLGATRFLVKRSDVEAANQLIAEALSEDFELGISDEELEAQALAAGRAEEEDL